jgi:hypothetical protein
MTAPSDHPRRFSIGEECVVSVIIITTIVSPSARLSPADVAHDTPTDEEASVKDQTLIPMSGFPPVYP